MDAEFVARLDVDTPNGSDLWLGILTRGDSLWEVGAVLVSLLSNPVLTGLGRLSLTVQKVKTAQKTSTAKIHSLGRDAFMGCWI